MKKLLRQSNALRGAVNDIRTIRRRWLSNTRSINKYIINSAEPKLHIGANKSVLPGWLETDIEPQDGITYLDATRSFPLPSGVFSYIFAEHMIEHISQADAMCMLSECRRVLRAGGVLRIATPDLAFILSLYGTENADSQYYLEWITERFLPENAEPTAVNVINNAFRAWGHQYLYDEPSLEWALRRAGFTQVRRVEYGASSHNPLRGVERHGLNIGNDRIARLETMVFEAE